MPSRNKAGCSCCGGVACTIYSGGWLISDTTTVPNATELVGDWEIISTLLHPDHAASDQRIRFDTASSDLDVVFIAQVQGQSGDRVGACLFLDADGDSFVEATIQFGSGTAGRLNMKRFTNGSLDWTTNVGASPACGLNEYDFTPGATYWLAISHKSVTGGSIWRLAVSSTSLSGGLIGSGQGNLGTVEYFDSAGVGAVTSFTAGCVTGTDAITATFGSVEFYHIYAPCNCYLVTDFPEYRAQPCDYAGAEYDEEEGDWDLETINGKVAIVTDSEPATLLIRDVLRSPSAHVAQFFFGTRGSTSIWDFEPLKFRWCWDWADDDNYWCVEFEFGVEGVVDCDDAIRIIERASGVETVHEEKTGIGLREESYGSAGIFSAQQNTVVVDSDGYVFALMNDMCDIACFMGVFCGGPYSFTGTGRTAFKVMDAPTGFVLNGLYLQDGVGDCELEAQCTTCGDDRPPDPDGPGPNGCCSDATDLELGDEVEFTMTAFDIESGEPCESDDCYSDISTVFLALNNPFLCEVVWSDSVVKIIYGDTGVHVTCGGSPGGIDVTAKIWVWITRTGEDTCTLRGILDIPTCPVYWEVEITPEAPCLGTDMIYVSRAGDATCCLDFAGSTCRISLP